tara:strand:+ start:1635 stop:3245 length:1611 start_codon:yes stop_codon:yes gene_type:complete
MILSKSEYIEKINSLLQDNSTQLISPLDLRISLRDLADSVHLFTDGNEIVSANFATPDTRSTIAGELALGKLKYAGRSSVDNSAFGYYALGANFEGSQNTAGGSHALGCNLDGTYNTAFGFNSLAGNTQGSGNTAIGSFSLQSLRTGSFNIAIGHGAGSHIPTDHSYKFFLGVDPIDSGYDCQDYTSASGAVPLMYGDMQERRLSIGIGWNHPYGTLQVSGDITPSHSGEFNLGNKGYPWNSVNEIIHFSGEKIGVGTDAISGVLGSGPREALMTVNGSIVPKENGIYSLGWSGNGAAGADKLLWDGYFNDIFVKGNAIINDAQYNTINECLYDCKTLHLATSGLCDDGGVGFHNDTVCGYLSDELVDGAGFEVHSSGYDYTRDYKFIFRNSDPNITCLEEDSHWSRSRWQSNISIEVASGSHVQVDRILGGESLSMVKQSGCYGIFSKSHQPSGDRVYFSREPHVDSYPNRADINFIANSGTHLGADSNPSGYDYSVMYGTVDSGVKITHEFASRIKTTSGKRGFSIVYHDELDA